MMSHEEVKVEEIDDPVLLRERINGLEATLECMHKGLHEMTPSAQIALQMMDARFYHFMRVLLCGPEDTENDQELNRLIVRYVETTAEALVEGDFKRSVNR